jgi:hypothetical protein
LLRGGEYSEAKRPKIDEGSLDSNINAPQILRASDSTPGEALPELNQIETPAEDSHDGHGISTLSNGSPDKGIDDIPLDNNMEVYSDIVNSNGFAAESPSVSHLPTEDNFDITEVSAATTI